MIQPGKNESWLTNWLYEASEWKRFTRWELLKKGGLSLLLYLLTPFHLNRAKEVKVSQNQVMINGRSYLFHSDSRELQTADLYDNGQMHILEICYKENKRYGVIRIPVPKGKLKEAIMLEKFLHEKSIPFFA